MDRSPLRRLLLPVLVALPFVAWFSMRYDPYAIDGDAVSYMDIADLIHAHRWAGVVNAYWHPLYPSLLLLGQLLFHPTRANELDAYYKVNLGIFLLQAVAMLAFTASLAKLRDRMNGAANGNGMPRSLLSADALRLLGIALLVVASQRELTLGKVRPDGLLQAMFLFGFAAMLQLCAAVEFPAQLGFGALMGLCFGLAYLTKSFAFLLALLSVAAVVVFQFVWLKRNAARALVTGALAFLVFAAVAGPYMAALSYQKHRLDFGDSGSLNYAWYVGGTEKFHLEPWQKERFGTSDVHLVHPERQLLAEPGIYSYKAEPYGTIPPWFDASFFNERIVTHMHLNQLLARDGRNAVLVLRYLLNHPEAWLLLGLLLYLGARVRGGIMRSFWVLPASLGLAIWAIYSLVNVEERYVTAGYLVLLLPIFAALQVPGKEPEAAEIRNASLPVAAATAIALLALLSLGESLRIAAEQRRQESIRNIARGWQDSAMFAVADGLQRMGVRHGEEIACVGTVACVYDPYWMRLAGVRTTTEIFMDHDHLAESLTALANRQQVYQAVKREGARVLVGHFDGTARNMSTLSNEGWRPLGQSGFYALPLGGQTDGTR